MINRLLIRLLLLSFTWLAGSCLYFLIKDNEPQFRNYMLVSAADNNSSIHNITVKQIYNYIRTKNILSFTLDSNIFLNRKKMEVIRYESLKIKAMEDSNTIIRVSFENKTPLRFLYWMLDICEKDRHRSYTLLPNKFIIFPGDLSYKEIEKRKKRQQYYYE